MMNIVGRGANLPTYLKATSQVVASGLKPAAVAVPVAKETPVFVNSGVPQSNTPSGRVSARSSLTGKLSQEPSGPGPYGAPKTGFVTLIT